MLNISNLSVNSEDKQIIKDLSLSLKQGETHAIMGPNGAGKSTLLKVLAGDPNYQVVDGSIDYEVNFNKFNLLELEADERSKEGIFLSFQYPIEIPGVSNKSLLKTAFDSLCTHQGIEKMNDSDFEEFITEKAKSLKVPTYMLERSVNVDFSGGEKKKNEILQMAILKPSLALLDETDSGLDIDSMKVIAQGINKLRNKDNSFLLVTHYHRLLDYVKPDYVHVLYNGKIIKTSDHSLAREIEDKGYDWLINQ